jgi:nuclear pore complex protein Nup133
MFNSPAPRQTPRRGVNRPRDSVSLSRGTPSIFSDQQDAQSLQPNRYPIAPLTPSIRGSRLAVARGLPPSPTSSAGETIRTARAETDSYERVIWAKNDRTVVSSAGGLPKEVQSIIKQSGEYTDHCVEFSADLVAGLDMMTTPVSGHLDTASGFAFITTSTACIAWNYQKVCGLPIS